MQLTDARADAPFELNAIERASAADPLRFVLRSAERGSAAKHAAL